MTQIFLKIYDFFESRRSLLFGGTILLVSLLSFLATRVRFDEKITDIFPKTEEGKNMSMVFDNLKSKDRIIVLFTANDASTTTDELIERCDLFADQLEQSEAHKAIQSITAVIDSDQINRTTDFIYKNLPIFLDAEDYRRIDSLIEHHAIGQIMQSNYQRLLSPVGIGLSRFIAQDPLSIASKTLRELQNFNPSLSYTLYDDHIFSQDKTTCLMILKSKYASNDTAGNEPIIDALDDLIEQHSDPRIDISYFGTPGIALYNARQIKNDTYITLTLALLLVIGVITSAFHNRWAVLLITLPVCFGGLFALSCIALTTGHISMIAIGAGAAVFGIAISYSTHVVCHANHASNARTIVEELSYPMIVGSITTIGAFVALMFTASPLLNDFGLFAALTLIGTPLFSLIVLPHLLERNTKEERNRLLQGIEKINAYPFERNRPLVFIILVFFGIGVFTYNRVGFDSDMSHLSYTPSKIAQAEQQLEKLFSVDGKSITLVASGQDVECAVQRYTDLCHLLDRKQASHEIESLVSAERFIVAPSLQEQKIERWDAFWKEGNKRSRLLQIIEQEGRRAGFNHGAFSDFAALINQVYSPIDYADQDQSTPLLDAWINSSDCATLVLAQIKTDDTKKDALYDELSQMEGIITIDRGYFANKMAKTVNDDFNYVLYVSGFLVFFTLLLTYRRWELTLMTFAPMFIAFTIILGLMAVLGFEFNIVNIILSTFIFGIGDDFSIFIMDGLQCEYSNGRRMLAHHKTAIFFSVLTTIIGIGALCFANHPVLRSTSLISIIGMTAVIVSAYTILPLLFRWTITRPVAGGGEPYTLVSLGRTAYGFILFLLMSIAAQIIIPTLIFFPISGRIRRRWMHVVICKGCRAILWMTSLTEHKILINESKQKFDRPSIIIANHHSFVDILLLLSLSPRLVMITNSWVWRSSIFGRIIRYLGFCSIESGYEEMTEHVKQNFEEGYSVVVFPEGTRSKDGRSVGRFHKGAFYLAEQLHADIVPILIYGTGMICAKRQPFNIRKGNYGAQILPPILFEDASFGVGYRQRTKKIAQHFKLQYEQWCAELDTVENPYFRETIIKNYMYKTGNAEFMARRLLHRTHNFKDLVEGIGRQATIVIFGAGQGEEALMLGLLSPQRHIIAYEEDEEKINLTRHCTLRSSNIEFIKTDYRFDQLPQADCYIFTRLCPKHTIETITRLCPTNSEIRYE